MAHQPQQTRRAAAYIRESTEEQGRDYSPDGQRQAIARYAADHEMRLVEEYVDFETGRLADKRPDFQRLIEHAMEHRFDVVLVFHTSRLARNTIEAKHYKKLLRTQLGIEVISVTQPLGTDVNDSAAFLSESVHEIFDEYLLGLIVLLDKDWTAREGTPRTAHRQPAVGPRQGQGRHRRSAR